LPAGRTHHAGAAARLPALNSHSKLKTLISILMPTASLETLHDLFVHELRDLYDAENQLIKALPLMAQAAQAPELKRAFDTHLRETKEQVRRLEMVFKGLGEKPSGKSCKAMQGLVAEGNELLEEDADPDVMDAALIVAAQKIEHYEIASYGSVCTFGRVLGYNDATEVLKETMAEEERTDKLLTGIAQKLNPEAESADDAKGAEGSGDDTSDLRAGRGNRESGGEGGQGGDGGEMSAGRSGRGSTGGGANRMRSGGSNRGGNAGGGRGRSSSRKAGGAKSSRGTKGGRSRGKAASRSRR
jgi:ferritin-like metal-binding protein YciE